jgi:hypothetical protein
MKSKLLQKITHGVSQPRDVVNGQQENTKDSSMPWRPRENPPGRVSPPVDVEARKGFPRHLRYDDRRQHRQR